MNETATVPAQTLESRRCCSSDQNISQNERLASLLIGGGLAAIGLSRKSGLGLLSLATGASLIYRGWSGHCYLYEQLGIDHSQASTGRPGVRAQHGRKVVCSLHINRDKDELYRHWRDLENLPNMMRHLESVEPIDDKRSHWTASAPWGQTLQWDAEIITDRPGEVLAWQSLPGSQVDTAGSVHFQTPPHGEGTEVTVTLKYDPPGGAPVAQLAALLGYGLEQEVREDLRRFKQLMEAGEVATAAQHP